MQQPHRNLFFSYRGSVRRSKRSDGGSPADDEKSDRAFDRQLEDNATKALVYVLEHADRSHVLGAFLALIVGLDMTSRLNEVQFALQRVDIARPSIKRRIILSITPTAELTLSRAGIHSAGRPDAWIWLEGVFGVLIETKVRGQASVDQLRRHAESADGWSWRRVSIKSSSWSEVFDLFENLRGNRSQLDPVTSLLLDELVRYLKMTGLSSTTTFDLEDFGYFTLPPEERHDSQRALLKRKLLRFTEDLSKTKAMLQVVRHYAGGTKRSGRFVNPGVFRKDGKGYWITVGQKERRNRCHFTVRLSERGISLEVFSPHKSFTSRLVRKIQATPNDFVASLRPMKRKDPYFVRLREAYYYDPHSSYKGQRISHSVDFLEVHPRVITLDNLQQLIIEPVEVRP